MHPDQAHLESMNSGWKRIYSRYQVCGSPTPDWPNLAPPSFALPSFAPSKLARPRSRPTNSHSTAAAAPGSKPPATSAPTARPAMRLASSFKYSSALHRRGIGESRCRDKQARNHVGQKIRPPIPGGLSGEILRGGGEDHIDDGLALEVCVCWFGCPEAPVLVIRRISTRRFFARPAEVLFVSTGLSLPSPMR